MLYEIKNGDTVVEGVNVDGNTGWKDVKIVDGKVVGYDYTLTINNDNYQGSISGTITINQATPTVTLPTYTEELYEDRINVEDIEADLQASTDGTFEIITDELIYKTPESGVTYDTITVEYEFTPEDTINYKSFTKSFTLNIYPVAYVGSKYYGTVDKAIQETSEGTIYVIPGTNPIIKTNNLSIPSGVTLFLPHTEGSSLSTSAVAIYYTDSTMNGDGTSFVYNRDNPASDGKGSKGVYFGADVATTNPEFLRNSLYVANNVSLINNG